jgi:hypothetical protein
LGSPKTPAILAGVFVFSAEQGIIELIMRVAGILKSFRRPATYVFLLILLVSTFSTRWMMNVFESCGSSPESNFEMRHCRVEEGVTRFHYFDLTDTPTSALRLVDNVIVEDKENVVSIFPQGLPAVFWTHNTYAQDGIQNIVVSLLVGIVFLLDILYLLLLSVLVTSHWSQWSRGVKMIVGVILFYLYCPPLLIFIVARLVQGD